MDARQLLQWFCLSFGVMIPILGCVTPDPSVDLLEGELRWMEDQLYMLEDELQRKCAQLTACRQGSDRNSDDQPSTPTRRWSVPKLDSSAEPETLPPPSSSDPEIIRSPDEPTPVVPPGNGAYNPEQDNSITDGPERLPERTDDFDLGVPEIELPAPESIRGERPQFETPPIPPPSSAEPPANTEGGSAETQVAPLLLGRAVHHIKINSRRVTTYNKISDEDEEKLLVVVEPLGEQNEFIELSAPMTVVIEDADKKGAASLGSWEFNALETGRTLRESNMGRGIHLALDWPRDVPLVDNLRVFVTYTTLDGTRLAAEQLLHPTDQTTSVAGWTPVAKSRPKTAVKQPKNDLFMLAEQQQEKSPGAVFRTVPIPAKEIPSRDTAHVSRVAHDTSSNSSGQVVAAGFQSEIAVDESLTPLPITATNDDGRIARPTWQPYR